MKEIGKFWVVKGWPRGVKRECQKIFDQLRIETHFIIT
jgi:hypothetical protein